MGVRERQRQVQLYRGQVPSPGRPTVAWREDRVRFCSAIVRGAKTEDACVDARVSGPVGSAGFATLAGWIRVFRGWCRAAIYRSWNARRSRA